MVRVSTEHIKNLTSASSTPEETHPSADTSADLIENGKSVEQADFESSTADAEKTSSDSGSVSRSGDDNTAQNGGNLQAHQDISAAAPPLPEEELPLSSTDADDGWAPVWEESAQAFYFYNRFTGATQWTNPRVPGATIAAAPEAASSRIDTAPPPSLPPVSGYNPAIHGDYDPNAWYAQSAAPPEENAGRPTDPNSQYAATAAFNRFTGRFQNPDLNPENFNDENKSKRQMNAFFDVDAAANSHDGRSLKAERSGKKLTKTELKQFKEKRKAKKEEKRRAWLRD